jgi:LPXTG-motif cell wall-anchored protein
MVTRTRFWTALLTVVGLLLPAGAVFGQSAPEVQVISSKRFEALEAPGPIDVVQLVLDFRPGAGVPTHTHGGPVFVTVLEGAITLVGEQGEETFQAGQTLIELPTQSFSARNPTDGSTRLFATYVLPRGATLTTVAERAVVPALGPTTVAETWFTIDNPPARFDLVQLLLDLPPGAWTPPHSHGGPAVVSVLEGQVTGREPGLERRFGPGEGWTEHADDPHTTGNDGAARASVATTILLPTGAELTTVQEALPGAAPAPAAPARPIAAPAAQVPTMLPRTGSLPPSALAVAGLGLVAAGSLLRRRAG